jgi:protoporphyrinogen IX oxidase
VHVVAVMAWMVGLGAFREAHWLSVKLGLVVVLGGVHLMLVDHLSDFAGDQNRQSERCFRMLNEVPTVLIIAMVGLVFVRPI